MGSKFSIAFNEKSILFILALILSNVLLFVPTNFGLIPYPPTNLYFSDFDLIMQKWKDFPATEAFEISLLIILYCYTPLLVFFLVNKNHIVTTILFVLLAGYFVVISIFILYAGLPTPYVLTVICVYIYIIAVWRKRTLSFLNKILS